MLSNMCKEVMVIDKFMFTFHKNLADDVQRWKCTTRGCKAYFKRDNKHELFDKHLEHNHSHLDESVLRRKAISNNLKRKAQDRLHDRPAELLRDELEPAVLNVLTAHDFSAIRKSIHYARSKYLSKSVQESQNTVHTYTSNNEQDAGVSQQIEPAVATRPELSSTVFKASHSTPKRSSKQKRFKYFETEESKHLSTEDLQRLLIIEQLKLARIQTAYYEKKMKALPQ